MRLSFLGSFTASAMSSNSCPLRVARTGLGQAEDDFIGKFAPSWVLSIPSEHVLWFLTVSLADGTDGLSSIYQVITNKFVRHSPAAWILGTFRACALVLTAFLGGGPDRPLCNPTCVYTMFTPQLLGTHEQQAS